MEGLIIEMGAVENSAAFIAILHSINNDLGPNIKGVEIIPANVEMPGQNSVERHIQTFDNMEAAITIDQD